MRIITRQTLANVCADSWKGQYKSWPEGSDKLEIAEKLTSLGSCPDPDQVDEVIGNTSWTRTRCDECGSVNIPVMELGEDLNYESCTANICRSCLIAALEMTE